MMKRISITMLVLAAAVAPAMAQSGSPAPRMDAPAPVVHHADAMDDDGLWMAALDDPALLADDVDGGGFDAPMADDDAGGGGATGGPGAAHGRHGAGGPMGMHGRRGGGAMGGESGMHAHLMMMAGRLDLTDAQREKIHGILAQQMRRGIQERADIQLANLDLQQLMHAENPNLGSIDAQVDKVARLRATLAKERIASMMQIHAVLTPEQKSKLRDMRMGGMRRGRDDDSGAHDRGGMN